VGASVRFLLPNGSVHVLPLGGIVGRSPYSAVHIDDPAISEAHALLSWRGGELRLIALRRRFAVRGQAVEAVRLFEGDEIELAPGWAIEILEVTLPPHVLTLEGAGLPTQLLPDVAALTLGPPPTLSTRISPSADATLWQSSEMPPPGVRIRSSDGGEITPDSDGNFALGGQRFRILAVPTRSVADAATGRPSQREALSVTLDGELVRIGDISRTIEFQGVQGRLLRILTVERVACDWPTLASRVWTDRADWDALRSRLDTTVSRIRQRLKSVGFAPALLRSNGAGGFLLALEERDHVLDTELASL